MTRSAGRTLACYACNVSQSPAMTVGSTMALGTNYYEVLQVSPNADASVIDAAYQRLAQLSTPDHNLDSSAGKQMALLKEAHLVLSDVQKRRQYDMASGRF